MQDAKPQNPPLACWAIVELMGHVRIAGRLTEEEHFGAKLGRLDIPTENPCLTCGGSGNGEVSTGPDPVNDPCAVCLGRGKVPAFTTQFFGGSSVYRITPTTEEIAREIAKNNQPEPVHAWQMPKRIGQNYDDEEDGF